MSVPIQPHHDALTREWIEVTRKYFEAQQGLTSEEAETILGFTISSFTLKAVNGGWYKSQKVCEKCAGTGRES